MKSRSWMGPRSWGALTALSLALPRPATYHRPALVTGRLWGTPTYRPEATPATIGILGDGSHDHRYAGLWIGLGLGATLTALNLMFCSDRDTGCSTSRPLTYGPIMTVVLGTTGALVGAQIGRGPSPDGR